MNINKKKIRELEKEINKYLSGEYNKGDYNITRQVYQETFKIYINETLNYFKFRDVIKHIKNKFKDIKFTGGDYDIEENDKYICFYELGNIMLTLELIRLYNIGKDLYLFKSFTKINCYDLYDLRQKNQPTIFRFALTYDDEILEEKISQIKKIYEGNEENLMVKYVYDNIIKTRYNIKEYNKESKKLMRMLEKLTKDV